MAFYLTVILISIITYMIGSLWIKKRLLPYGPCPIPLLGNCHQLGYNIYRGKTITECLRSWQQHYGNIFSFWIGPMPTVNLCDYDTAYEAMIKKGVYFVDRPKMLLFDVIRHGRGIVSANGVHWMEQRRFALQTLKNLGMGKTTIEDRIMMEVEARRHVLTEEIDNHGWELIVDPTELFELTVGNIIHRMLFSERFSEESEKEFYKLKKACDRLAEKSSIFDFFMDESNVKYPPFKQRLQKILPTMLGLLNFMKEKVTERKAEIALGNRTLVEGSCWAKEDFLDMFLCQVAKEDIDQEIFNDESLAIVLLDLWFAGQETTTATLTWAFALLLINKDILHRIQTELDEVTMKKRHLTLADKTKTPFFNATITEIFRVGCIFPLNLWRVAAEDVTIGNVKIRKGTNVTALLSLIMTDPKYFEEPEKFDPTRFLGDDGKKLEQKVVAFGMGRRQCLGEQLARAEIYLILGNLLQWYEVIPDSDHPPSLKAAKEVGGFRRPAPYKVILRRRKQ